MNCSYLHDYVEEDTIHFWSLATVTLPHKCYIHVLQVPCLMKTIGYLQLLVASVGVS